MRGPKPPANAIERPRLIERLERGTGYPLTLVTGPAGSGKTTLLLQWAAARARLPVWLSLDASDRDPATALARLVVALQPLRLSLALPPRPDIEQTLVGLLNELAKLPTHVAVVLDNCHIMEGSPLAEASGRLLDYLPPQVHLVLSGRSRPPWPLGRLRVRSQLLEIGATELCFTIEETTALLQSVLGRVRPAQAEALHARCEGWALGLQRAAKAIRRRRAWGESLAAFSGCHPSLARYFEAEVLSCEPGEVQAFLLQTSVLERLSAPLCDAVTNRQDGQAMLEDLERRSLFTIPLDSERRWYRYHTLFASFLQGALEERNPELADDLRRRAAAWAQQV